MNATYYAVFTLGRGGSNHKNAFAIKINPFIATHYNVVVPKTENDAKITTRFLISDLEQHRELTDIQHDWNPFTIELVRTVRDKSDVNYSHIKIQEQDAFLIKMEDGSAEVQLTNSNKDTATISWNDLGIRQVAMVLEHDYTKIPFLNTNRSNHKRLSIIIKDNLLTGSTGDKVFTLPPGVVDMNKQLTSKFANLFPPTGANPNDNRSRGNDYNKEMPELTESQKSPPPPTPKTSPIKTKLPQQNPKIPISSSSLPSGVYNSDDLRTGYEFLASIPDEFLYPLDEIVLTPEHIKAFAVFATDGNDSTDELIGRVFVYNRFFGGENSVQLVDKIQEYTQAVPLGITQFADVGAGLLRGSKDESDEDIAVKRTIYDLGTDLIKKYENNGGSIDPSLNYFQTLILKYNIEARKKAGLESTLLNSIKLETSQPPTKFSPAGAKEGIQHLKTDNDVANTSKFIFRRRGHDGRFKPGVFTLATYSYANEGSKLSVWANDKYQTIKHKLAGKLNPSQKTTTSSTKNQVNEYQSTGALDLSIGSIYRKAKDLVYTPPDPYKEAAPKPTALERDKLEEIISQALQHSIGDSKEFDKWLEQNAPSMETIEKIKYQLNWLIRLSHTSDFNGVPKRNVSVKDIEGFVKKTEQYVANLQEQKERK